MVSYRMVPLVLAAFVLAGCSGPEAREYELQGQVVAVDGARQEVTIKHEDIRGFMPGMTMAFKVREPALLAERVPGDLVKATLVVQDTETHLRTLERTGFAPVADADRPPPRMRAPGEPVEDARFVSQDGTPTRLEDSRGLVRAVTFMYTRCPLPDFCPLVDRHFKSVQDRVRTDESLEGQVRLLSVTLDPAHDTPAVLSAHAAELKADGEIWQFLTTPDDLQKFAGQFGVSIIKGAEGEMEIVHNLRTAVIAGDGRLVRVLNGSEWTPDDLIAALKEARGVR